MAKIISEYEIEIEEKDLPGTVINLRDLKSIDTSFLKSKIESLSINDPRFKMIIEREVLNVSQKKDQEIRDIKNKLDLFKATSKQEEEIQVEKEKAKYQEEISTLKNDLILKSNSHQKEISELTNKHLLNNEKIKGALAESVSERVLEYEKTITEMKLKLENKTAINSAHLGNKLESELNDKLTDYYQDFENINVVFQPKPINSTKPDWRVDFKYDNTVMSIVLDAKTEDLASKTKTKNSRHLDKLDKDRINSGATFGILITELEPEMDFVIRKTKNYKYLIMCRPSVVIELLRILKIVLDSLSSKQDGSEENDIKLYNIIERVLPSYINIIDVTSADILKKVSTIKNSADSIEKGINKIMKRTEEEIRKLLN